MAISGGKRPIQCIQTPESKRRNTEDKTKIEKQELPPAMEKLTRIFAAVRMVYQLYRLKGKRVTHSRIQKAVEEAGRLRCEESHLLQLQTLLPEVVTLEISSDGDIEIVLDTAFEEAHTLLHERLVRHLYKTYQAYSNQVFSQPLPLSQVAAAFPDGIPDVPQAPLRKTIIIDQTPDIKPTRSTEVAPIPPDENILNRMPVDLRRRSIDGVISLESLQRLERNEMVYSSLASEKARQKRNEAAVLRSLSSLLCRLRRIFGSSGPSALKLTDAVSRLKQGNENREDIIAGLEELAVQVPEMVELKPWGECGTPAVWVRRSANHKQLLCRLRSLSTRRLSAPL